MEDWAKRWEVGDTPWRNTEANQLFYSHLPKIREHVSWKDDLNVLIPLCGTSDAVRYLYDSGFTVTGIELVPQALQILVEEQFSDIKLTQTSSEGLDGYSTERLNLICGDIFESPFSNEFDLIFDRGGLVAFPPDMHEKYAQTLESMVVPGGGLYIATYWAGGFFPEVPPYPIEPSRLSTLFPKMTKVFADESSSEPTLERYIEGGVKLLERQHALYLKGSSD